MAKSKNSNGLAAAVVFAAVVVSGSLVFFATQLSGGTAEIDSTDIANAIEQYVADKQAEAEPSAPSVVEVVGVSEDDHVFGNPDAKVTLIEYSDFECPFCKRFHPTAKQVIEAYDGEVNWVYRHFPLGFHDPLATKQAEASECVAELAGNDAFWEYADLIYENTSSNGRGMDMDELPKLAVEVGVEEGDFNDCLESGRYLELVQKAISEGRRAGVSGTPGNILLNNETQENLSVPGAQPFETLKAAVDQLLQ